MSDANLTSKRAASFTTRARSPAGMFRRKSMDSAHLHVHKSDSGHGHRGDESPASPSAVSRKSIVRQTFNPTAWATVTGDKSDDALKHVHKWHALTVDSLSLDDIEREGKETPLLGGEGPTTTVNKECLAIHVRRSFAFLIVNVLIVIEAVPFGLAFFPAAWTSFPAPRSLGIQMFMLSTAICQAVFALCSKFDMATGLMMCENIPFMNQIATEVTRELSAQGREQQALPTVLVAYAASTVLVGLAFYGLGVLKMGSAIGLIPPYIIQGCIGGIGIFITQTGVEISTGLSFAWQVEVLRLICSPKYLKMWVLSLCLSLLLRLMCRYIKSPMLTPIFFVTIPFVFHAAVAAVGMPYPDPRLEAWFFEKENAPEWWLLWELYDFGNVAWDVLPSQLGTFVALTIFSLIHVPINIPSLCMTTDLVADIDHELKAHGIANLLSGAVGCLQNYLCYSNSALYYKCGGGGNLYRALMAVVFFAFFVVGPSFIGVVPRCMAGSLMLHIGTELVREALVEPFGSIDHIEYVAVCLITLVMTIAGMTQGLLISAILALLTFVLQSSRVPVVAHIGHGTRVRSSTWRTIKELDILADNSWRIHLIQLQGTLFFGNFSQVSGALSAVLSERKEHMSEFLYIVLDMSAITCLDTAAAKALEKTYLELRDLNVAHMTLVLPRPLTGEADAVDDPAYAGLKMSASQSTVNSSFGCERPVLHLAPTLDKAVSWCEDAILARQLGTDAPPELGARPSLALEYILQTVAPNFASASEMTDGSRLQRELLEWFKLADVRTGQVIWREGDKPAEVLVLVSGHLRAEDETGATQDTDLRGCMLGEFGLITGERRQNTLSALADSKLYTLSLQRWTEMQEVAPRLAFVLSTVALKYAGNRLRQVAITAFRKEANAIPV